MESNTTVELDDPDVTYDAFVCYSRADLTFVQRLTDALSGRDKSAWIDLANRTPLEEWFPRVERAIEKSDSFVFVISQSALGSAECRRELQHAEAGGKKIIPVLHENSARAPTRAVPSLAKPEWIFLRPGDDFAAGMAELVSAVERDLEWSKAHTSLVMLSAEWERSGRDPSLLLRGVLLKTYMAYLRAEHLPAEPAVTDGQIEYVNASRRGRHHRIAFRSATGAGIGMLALLTSQLRGDLISSRDAGRVLTDFISGLDSVPQGTKNQVERMAAWHTGDLVKTTAKQILEGRLRDPGSRRYPASEWTRLIHQAGLNPEDTWRRIRQAQGL
jgi:hypothetical protein